MVGETSYRHFRFGLFEVDRVTGELMRAGVRVRLQGKPFDLLVALLEARGDLVTRDQALSWLSRSVDQREVDLVAIRVDPRLGPLHDDPRFEEIAPRIVPRPAP